MIFNQFKNLVWASVLVLVLPFAARAAVVAPPSLWWNTPTGYVTNGSTQTVNAWAYFNYSDDGYFNAPNYFEGVYRIMIQVLKPNGEVIQINDWLPGCPVGGVASASPTFTADIEGQYYVRYDAMDTRPWYPYGSGYSDWTASVYAYTPNTAPASYGVFNPTSLIFGQSTTISNTMTDVDGNITFHSLFWDQGMGKYWTNPYLWWDYEPNSWGLEGFSGLYDDPTTTGHSSHTITATFTPQFAGNFDFLIGGYDSFGEWVSNAWTYGQNRCVVSVSRATPNISGWVNQSRNGTGNFSWAFGVGLSNPYSGVTAPTGGVSFSVISANGTANPSSGAVDGSTIFYPGSYVVRAHYGGDGNYNAADWDVTFTVNNNAPYGYFTINGSSSDTSVNFGQSATISSTAIDPDGNLTIHSFWWDQGYGLYWTHPVYYWNYPANQAGWRHVDIGFDGYGAKGSWSSTKSFTFTGNHAGNFVFHSIGYDNFSWVGLGNTVVSLYVNKATPNGSFSGHSYAPGTIGYSLTAADLNASFSNPYSGGVSAPSGGVSYTIVGPGTAVSAGSVLTAGNSYTIRANYPGDGNYNATYSDATFTIARANQSAVSINSGSTVVFGNAYTATASGGNGSGGIVWALGAGSTAPGAAINSSSGVVSASGVGTVVFNAYRSGDGNYYQSATTGNFTLTVNPITTSFSVSPTSFTYNGAAQGPTITPLPAAATYASTSSTSATNAGSYTVTATANGNYSGTSGAVAWSIAKANQAAVSITSGSTSTFGSSYTATASGGNGTGAMVWALGAGSTAAGAAINSSSGVVSATGVGTVVFNCYRASDANYYQSATTGNFTLTVNPITTSFTVSPTSFSYNGAAQGPTITPSPAAGTYASAGTATATNVGSYSVTATANGNYSGNSGAVAWSIDKANQAAVSITSSSTSTFGSTYTATASGGNGTGAMVWALGTGSTAAGAAINSSSGVVSATGVGTVVFNAYRSGDGNYYQSATTGNFTLTVNPITTSFTVSPTSFSYNGAAQGPTITPSPAAATYSSSGSTSATLPGSYSLTATASGNYSGNSGAIAWSINKVAQTISFGSTTGKTYGDAPFDVYATASSGLPVTISVSSGPATISGTSITLTGAGTVVLSATQEGNTYYSAAPNVSQTFTVAQAAQTITLSPTSSTVLSTESVTFTVSGGVNAYSWGGSSGATGTGSTKTVSFPTAGTYTVTAQNSSSANYFASNVASATVTVNQAFTLSLSADPGGSVSGAGLFASGATASPTATANSGYVFAGWYGADSGSLSSTLSNPGSITMSAARNLTARFVDVSNIPTQSTIDFGAATIPTGTGKKNASRDSIMANVGNSPIELRAVQVVSGAADFSVSGTLGTIAGAANISNTVTFNPKGSALGSRTGRLVLITTDGLLPAIAYDLTGTASPGVLPPSISLSVTSLALIFPNDQIALNSRVDANQGNVAYYDWRVIKPSGVTAWSRFSGPLSSLVGSHGFTPTSTGVHTFEVMATHEDGPTSSASITFSVVQGLYTRTVSARNEPSTDLQLWFTPSATRTQSIEVWKSR